MNIEPLAHIFSFYMKDGKSVSKQNGRMNNST